MKGRCAAPVYEVNGSLPLTDCPRLPPTTLHYSQPESNTTVNTVVSLPGFTMPEGAARLPLLPVDVNSDSLPDLVETSTAASSAEVLQKRSPR